MMGIREQFAVLTKAVRFFIGLCYITNYPKISDLKQ